MKVEFGEVSPMSVVEVSRSKVSKIRRRSSSRTLVIFLTRSWVTKDYTQTLH